MKEKKIRVCKADEYFKNNRQKINRALTLDDAIVVLKLINKGYSQRKIYFLSGYNYYFIRNVAKFYSFLRTYIPKNDIDSRLTDKNTLLALMKTSFQDAVINEDDYIMEQLINVIIKTV